MWQDRLRRKRYQYYSANQPGSLRRSRTFVRLAKLSFLLVILGFLGFFVIVPLMAFNLPSPDRIVRQEGFSTKILDREGRVLYDIFAEQKRTPVALSDIPLSLRQATIAIEDKNFYSHEGFDVTGIVRALINIVLKGKLQGGSTLTQQLVKNVLLGSERTVFRKLREFVLSIQIERRYSKDQILQMYLNEAPYGGTAWGVEAAAETYFGKKVDELTLIESAFLAGLPQRPSLYSPYSANPKGYLGRTQEVLRRMREDGYIKRQEEEAAKEELKNLTFLPKGGNFKAPHFVQYVQKILEERYGERSVELGGLRVTTTLDLDLQEAAQEAVSSEIAKVESLNIGNGAAVVLDPKTGEVLAMVGSKNFTAEDYDGQVNVTLSLRQPGSAIKPITYATAFKKGFTPATLVMDVPTTFPGGAGQPEYKPVNYDGKYRGPLQLRFALGNSINLVAVKLLAMVGIKDTLQTAYDLGLTSLEPNEETLKRVGLSLTLGGGEVRLLELTSAYGAFMNGGYRVNPVAILKVEDANGKVLEEVSPKSDHRVITEKEAFLVASILSDNRARTDVFGPNSLLNIAGRNVAVKTGTTNDRRDNWAIGGNANAVVGAWVGNNDNSPMKQVASGVSGASPIWRRILLRALDGKPNVSFEVPDGIVTAEVDTVSGYRAHDGYPSRREYFIAGTEPGEDPVHVRLKVCKSDSKLATPSDVSSGNYEEKEFFVFKEEDPTAPGGPNRWQEGILNWLTTQGDWRYHPPNDYCGTQNPVGIEFISPENEKSDLGSTFLIKFSAKSTTNIVNAQLYIDENSIRGFAGPPYEHDLALVGSPLPVGVHKLKVVATDEKGNIAERVITIGVGTAWNATPVPSPQ